MTLFPAAFLGRVECGRESDGDARSTTNEPVIIDQITTLGKR